MSAKKGMFVRELARQQAMAEVLKGFVPQAFASPRHMTLDAPDEGINDERMMSNLPADVIMALEAIDLIAIQDGMPEYSMLTSGIRRAAKGINGFSVKMIESIAIGIGGHGQGKKSVRRPGWAGRNVTDRGWQERAEADNLDVEE